MRGKSRILTSSKSWQKSASETSESSNRFVPTPDSEPLFTYFFQKQVRNQHSILMEHRPIIFEHHSHSNHQSIYQMVLEYRPLDRMKIQISHPRSANIHFWRFLTTRDSGPESLLFVMAHVGAIPKAYILEDMPSYRILSDWEGVFENCTSVHLMCMSTVLSTTLDKL